jgi:acyl-homoserine-lactone acylase
LDGSKAGVSEYTNTAFKVPFNEADPINTPCELKITPQTRQALGDAIAYFQNKGIALDASLGELQYVLDAGKNNQRIPMHGGYGSEGIFNAARGEGVNEVGHYIINNGPTYMQAVTFDAKGPVVEALLAYSQAGDSRRPYHRDQTHRYSAKEWIRVPFSSSEISQKAVGEVIKLREES